MSTEENKDLIKRDSSFLQKAGNQISITNKLINAADDKLALEYFIKGINKSNIKNYIGAIEDYTKAIELNPNLSIAYAQRGSCKSKIEDNKGAIKDCSKAIEINPQFAAPSYNIRGYSKGKLGAYNDAIKDLNIAIELNPEYANAFYNRGQIKSLLGDENGANIDWIKAAELGSVDAKNTLSQ